jgi:hypothetical protein
MGHKYFLIVLMCVLARIAGIAQTIKGEMYDSDEKTAVGEVKVLNVNTGQEVISMADGTFFITATGGQLLEFSKSGYRMLRLRVPMGALPSYFKLAFHRGLSPLQELSRENRYNYREDSLRSYSLYKQELDFPTMSAIDMVAHPFSALSRRSQEIWRFQEDYAEGEKEKYIDRTFNETLIKNITGLSGDSVRNYIRRYRPSYEQLRSMNDYTFYSYIKHTVQSYRHPNRERLSQ